MNSTETAMAKSVAKDVVRLRRLIRTAIRDELEAVRLYEKTIAELEKVAESRARIGQSDAVLLLGLARNIEMIRNEEMKHYSYLRGIKI